MNISSALKQAIWQAGDGDTAIVLMQCCTVKSHVMSQAIGFYIYVYRQNLN